ncbi:MAG TPA: hypothetical protein V6C63_21620 [Allocoleopsis sp.]
MAQCKARNKSGDRCGRGAVPGKNVCHIHGGKTPVGVSASRFKHGRYSKYIPGRLMERYSEAVSDTELLAMREDIGLLDARLSDVLQRVDTGESGAIWKELHEWSEELAIARKTNDKVAMADALNGLLDCIKRGKSDYQAWNEVKNLLDQRRKLVESERKRLVEMQQFVSSEQAMLLVTALIDSVRRNVTDKQTLSTISAEFARLTQREGDPQLGDRG